MKGRIALVCSITREQQELNKRKKRRMKEAEKENMEGSKVGTEYRSLKGMELHSSGLPAPVSLLPKAVDALHG